MAKDLLIELGTEELPPKALKKLSQSFGQSIQQQLKDAKLNFTDAQLFATPRRLAIKISGVDEQQADQTVEKLGPAVAAAYDKEGKPSKAAAGFARSNGVDFEALEQVETPKGPRLAFKSVVKGLPTAELIPAMVENALNSLPIPKRMRWGSSRVEFVRPIHWLVLLLGDEIIPATVLGVTAGKQSRGHRFHSPEAFDVCIASYETDLASKKVIVDYDKRQAMIKQQVEKEAANIDGIAQISQDLLDEVTALVEWPVALTGNFEKRFLEVPAEALISSMKEHQKYFHVFDKSDALLPNFITVSNIESKDPAQVIDGNERVIRPRLSDAVFFFETDKKTTLQARREALKKIVFQKDLGTVFEKTERLQKLCAFIAEKIGSDVTHAQRAAELSKSDLVSEMVCEFTDLQGLMGYHYANHEGEATEVAHALMEQYLPKGADSALPQTQTGAVLALADRIDTLIGIFGIGQQPTGNKDPFALRRASLGIINIIIDKKLDVDLAELYQFAADCHGENLSEKDVVAQTLAYTIERFRAFYQAQKMQTEVFLSVVSRNVTKPLDFDSRVKAVFAFSQLEAASALAAANKRVANILAKQDAAVSTEIKADLLQEDAEKALVNALNAKGASIEAAAAVNDYQSVLTTLADLRVEVDTFFDNVMVMADDEALRNNRLAILQTLRNYFLLVADISLLAAK
ncbi:MAG: glycine--tRNA ligase subunit beta [Pseudomonadales bacterium]|nr:glycine--tRNA ligase subunit beta [Pseudomonadales bacterium]